MKTRDPDPRRLDLADWVATRSELRGEIPLTDLPRLADSVRSARSDGRPLVTWQVRGRVEREGGATTQRWLHLQAAVPVELTCQRCLQPVTVELKVDNEFRLARDEAEAERLDATIEADVLATDQAIDLQALVEDELLLALPLVPRHDDCRPPGAAGDDAPGQETDTHRPFAALAQWQRRKTS